MECPYIRDGYHEPITEISPVVPQASFRGKTDGRVAKMSAVFSGYESPSNAFYLVTIVINILEKANDQGIIILVVSFSSIVHAFFLSSVGCFFCVHSFFLYREICNIRTLVLVHHKHFEV